MTKIIIEYNVEADVHVENQEKNFKWIKNGMNLITWFNYTIN